MRIVTVVAAFALTLATGVPAAGLAAGAAAGAITVYFVSNLVTSGTEGFGWPGYQHPELRRHERTFREAAWKGGIIWAAWRHPLMLILYWQLGFVMIMAIAGFTASFVGMAWVTALIYERSNSIAPAAFLHALNNHRRIRGAARRIFGRGDRRRHSLCVTDHAGRSVRSNDACTGGLRVPLGKYRKGCAGNR